MKIFAKLFSSLAVLAVVIGTGHVNPNMTGPQAKMMARQAARVDIQKQINGQAFHIIAEQFDGSHYYITAEF